MSDTEYQLGIIGGGMMAESILSCLISKEVYHSSQIQVSDVSSERLAYLKSQYFVQGCEENAVVASSSRVLLLAIKPQLFDAVTSQFATEMSEQCLVISILAGIPIAKLELAFAHCPVVRVMPNTPATVGAGMTAIATGIRANQKHLEVVQKIFSAVGEIVTVSESLMDAVTGLSGSGPAFIALVMEALTDGGVSVGLPRKIATQLALQTLLGTATLMRDKALHPAQLKDQVTSPGGTTIAGVAALEEAGLRSALINAVQAAYHRSRELGQE